MQVPRTPGIQTAGKKSAGKKTRVKVRDLPPLKAPKGGRSAILRNDPPLPIPPPGFIVNSHGEKDGSEN
jgi:hypothetical protein